MTLDLVEAFWSDHLIGRFHVIAAAAALIVGPAIFFTKKGVLPHRIMGYFYVATMAIVNVTALVTYELSSGPNLFHFFAVVSLLTVTPGIYNAIRARITGSFNNLIAHYYFMCWSYFGLLAAFLSQIATQLEVQSAPFGVSPNMLILIITGAGAVIASIVIGRFGKTVIARYR